MAPFTLDLTGIDPDIVYCVDVYNITCGGRDLVSSDCNVTDTRYLINDNNIIDTLGTSVAHEYIVTPRSNVEHAVNGTPSLLIKGIKSIVINKVCTSLISCNTSIT